ncbi:MAG: PucR family transcriptional regulator [Actinomycetota bacterium]
MRTKHRNTTTTSPPGPTLVADDPVSTDGLGPPGREGRASLGQLIDNIGPSVVRVIVAPRGVDVPVGEPVIHDPLEPSPVERDAVVLAVGLQPEGSAARELVESAGTAGAAAVVFKLRDRRCDVVADAEAAGVALMAAADEMSWSHFNGLLTSALRSWVDPGETPGMASVPVGDLFALANAIAALGGGAVTIEDPRARVLAYSNIEGQSIDEPRQRSILGRQVPDTPGVRALYRRLWSSDGVIEVDSVQDLEINPRLAVPVRVGGETLGSIWIVQGDKPLAKDAKQTLAEAARVAALHMIHARASKDIERRVRGDLLRGPVEGNVSLESAAPRLGIEPGAVLEILGFELPEAELAEEELRRERLVDLVALYCEAFRRRAVCVSIGRTVYALLPASEPMPRDRVVALAGDILEQAEVTLGTTLHVAVGSTVAGVRELPSARREVDQILAVLSVAPGQSRVATIDDVQSPAILLQLRELATRNPEITRGRLGTIAEHDAKKGTSYVQTLEAYLDAFGDVPSAAARIGVHPNTFRYRLRRLITMFDLDLSDPDERLVLGLQLRLLPASSPGDRSQRGL